MTIRSIGPLLCGGLLALVVLTVAALPAGALDDRRQILISSGGSGENSTAYFVLGTSAGFGESFPNAETAASVRMPAGTFKKLRFNAVTDTTPSSGSLRVRVRVNGADTNLTCTVAGTGVCNKSVSIIIANNAVVVLKVSNDFAGSGVTNWTASFEFD